MSEDMEREALRARYLVFDKFAVKDQKNYYQATVENYKQSARQVNFWRALFAFATGFVAAAAGVIAQGADSTFAGILVTIFAVLAVVLPAIGAVFNSLADLYQWDKLSSIYQSALENLEVADSLSPVDEIQEDQTYRGAARSFAEGAISVMRDETAQWGQSIRTPEELQAFVEKELEIAESLSPGFGDSDDDKIPKLPPPNTS
jgi:hypothetical protein